MNEMELLFQASRTNPILHEAAVFVEAELNHLTQTLSRVHDIATRGVGADTTPEEALATIAAYIEKRRSSCNPEPDAVDMSDPTWSGGHPA